MSESQGSLALMQRPTAAGGICQGHETPGRGPVSRGQNIIDDDEASDGGRGALGRDIDGGEDMRDVGSFCTLISSIFLEELLATIEGHHTRDVRLSALPRRPPTADVSNVLHRHQVCIIRLNRRQDQRLTELSGCEARNSACM